MTILMVWGSGLLLFVGLMVCSWGLRSLSRHRRLTVESWRGLRDRREARL